jgi:RNA polymerase sigma-70 factor (ECF subfamily)
MIERLKARAADGDEDAFRELTTPYRRELQFHCYRMLGSMPDAEDALQETMLRAWRALPALGRQASVRAWLYRIATNRCLDMLRDERRRPARASASQFRPPTPSRIAEPPFFEPYPDVLLDGIADAAPGPQAHYETRETVELAFVAALQELPPRQRAALVLRDVLGFRAAEVANMVASTEDAVKSALKRARATMAESVTDRDHAPLPNSPEERELVGRFADAWERDDIEVMVGLLTADAHLTMPPMPFEYHGAEAIRGFLSELKRWRDGRTYRLVATRANTQPAFGVYRPDDQSALVRATGLLVLTLAGSKIAALTAFLDPSIVSRFGLPRSMSD